MTDGNTYEINKRLHDQEDFDALQEVTAELEQAEARIEELEAKLAAKEKLMLALAGDKIDLVSELAGVKGKLSKSEALLEKAVSFTRDAAYRATTIEHDRDEMWLLDLDVLRHERDCDITQARAALAELKGQE